jgi:hypothetical protein
MSDFLSTEEVCGQLALAGVDEATVGKVFAARLRPQNLTEPDKKFVLGVPGPSGQVYLVVYKFGLGQKLVKSSPLDEDGPDWRPRWMSVEGPFTLEEAPDKAKELTS